MTRGYTIAIEENAPSNHLAPLCKLFIGSSTYSTLPLTVLVARKSKPPRCIAAPSSSIHMLERTSKSTRQFRGLAPHPAGMKAQITLTDSKPALKAFTDELPDCKDLELNLYVDLEGNHLSRDGTVSLITVLVERAPSLRSVSPPA